MLNHTISVQPKNVHCGDHMADLSVDGRAILKLILEK
jgi:hypothetical protein